MEGRAQAQILPFVQNGTITLIDTGDIIRILEPPFGDPDPAATAQERLHTLKQGKMDFATYYAEFQMHVAKLHWGEHAKMDALREGLSIELHGRLISAPDTATFAEFVATCQQLDSKIGAFQARQSRRSAPAHRTQPAPLSRLQHRFWFPILPTAQSLSQDPWTSLPITEGFPTTKGLPDFSRDIVCTAEEWVIWQTNAPTRAGKHSVPLPRLSKKLRSTCASLLTVTAAQTMPSGREPEA